MTINKGKTMDKKMILFCLLVTSSLSTPVLSMKEKLTNCLMRSCFGFDNNSQGKSEEQKRIDEAIEQMRKDAEERARRELEAERRQAEENRKKNK